MRAFEHQPTPTQIGAYPLTADSDEKKASVLAESQ
jgi:hypothetical protein